MDTKEFTNHMIKIRQESKINISDFCSLLNIERPKLYNNESMKNIPSLAFVIKYLDILDVAIELNGPKVVYLTSNDDFIEVLNEARKNMSNYKIAKMSGCVGAYISKLSKGGGVPSLEKFLNITQNALGYKVSLYKKKQEKIRYYVPDFFIKGGTCSVNDKVITNYQDFISFEGDFNNMRFFIGDIDFEVIYEGEILKIPYLLQSK